MELIKYFWIIVLALAVVHGVVSALQGPRARPGAAAPAVAQRDLKEEQPDAVEEMARMEQGLVGLPKNVRVWTGYTSDDD